MNLADVVRSFPTEEACEAFLESKRWPNGVECIKCGSKRISRTTSKGKMSKKTGLRGPDRRLLECSDCRKQFTVKNDTLFGDSHIPMTKWFMAIAVICQAKKGISANQVGRTIGVTTKTAWYLCHRIREAMDTGNFPMLSGTVEIDETYVGGKQRKGEPRKTYWERKFPMIGIREREGRVRFQRVARANAKHVAEVIEANVSPGVRRIMTDESAIYPFALNEQQRTRHFTVNHSLRYVEGEIHTNGVEGSFSLFKRGLVGSYHRLSFKHLDRYLHEFEFKANNRTNPGMFQDVVTNIAAKPRLQFRALVDGEQGLPF